MGIRASLSFRYIAPTTRMAKSSILTPKIAKIPFAETGWARDRIAPNCTIRHPVRPIVALQRRMRFSARLRGFAGVGGTRDALEGRNGPHFWDSSLIAIFECHVCAQ